jgi:hypothetical protein
MIGAAQGIANSPTPNGNRRASRLEPNAIHAPTSPACAYGTAKGQSPHQIHDGLATCQ